MQSYASSRYFPCSGVAVLKNRDWESILQRKYLSRTWGRNGFPLSPNALASCINAKSGYVIQALSSRTLLLLASQLCAQPVPGFRRLYGARLQAILFSAAALQPCLISAAPHPSRDHKRRSASARRSPSCETDLCDRAALCFVVPRGRCRHYVKSDRRTSEIEYVTHSARTCVCCMDDASLAARPFLCSRSLMPPPRSLCALHHCRGRPC
jgi:hypothetical protein